MERILLLEDDLALIDGLLFTLQKNEFEVDNARTVAQAMDFLKKKSYDLLLLDVSLPDGSGFKVCQKVRESSQVPIIFLTAADEECNVVKGLDLGGDDYIAKPFRLGELLSRIRALLRRAGKSSSDRNVLQTGHLRLDLQDHTVSIVNQNGAGEEKRIELTAAEYKLLYLLMSNSGRVLTRQTILAKLWDDVGEFVDDNTLSVYIRRLREKIEPDPSNPRYIHTIRGFGYRVMEGK